MSLVEKISSLWNRFQQNLFPDIEDAVGTLTELHRKLIVVLDVACVEAFIRTWYGLPGRPQAERQALARAFIAMAVYNMPSRVALIDRLKVDKVLRRLCGWERAKEIPSESTFSRAFAEFAETNLPGKVHEALIKDVVKNRLVGHISRDATAIEARERPHVTEEPTTAMPVEEPKKKRGRPRKGEERLIKEPRRIEKQAAGMSLTDMIADLPKDCDVGVKRNAKGYQEKWIGYKLHIDTADGDIPISCILTSASVHDSQVAIPLATMTSARGVVNCYDLMDSAYDVPEIKDYSRALGHVPIIDINPRRDAARKELKEGLEREAKVLDVMGLTIPENTHYNERSAAERVNGQLKDSYGGKTIRVRSNAKVACHLMFGILSITVLQIMRLVT